MITIKISEETNSTADMSDLLRNIAKQIDEGFTSGAYPHWTIIDKSECEEKIVYIKNVLSTWGMTTTAELGLKSSPVYNNGTGKVCTLVEEFTEGYARLVTYDDEINISEEDVPYEELPDDLIDEIYEIILNYEAEQIRTEKRCSN